jgi:hypothetical protein
VTAFIITKDNVAPSLKDILPDIKSEVGTIGPRGASEADIARLKAGEGVKFRLREDGEDKPDYYGRRLESSDADETYWGEPELAPLDCFGTPMSGCAIQEEKNEQGKWEAIN